MSDWEKTQGAQASRPDEIDATTSSVFVYQRRNIERITVKNEGGTTTEPWQCEERKMNQKPLT